METDYIEQIKLLESEWPENKLRKFIADHLRESCEFALKKRSELEIENKDARMKGVSYAKRKRYTMRIETADFHFKKWKEMGISYSKRLPKMSDLVRPEDMSYIHNFGFEEHVKNVLTFI